MFGQLYKRPFAIARHATAPYAEERARYLDYCRRRGDSPAVVLMKASDLLWIARKLSVYPDLQLTIDQIRAVVVDCDNRVQTCRRHSDGRRRRKRLIAAARGWLRYLGCLRKPVEQIPFQSRLVTTQVGIT